MNTVNGKVFRCSCFLYVIEDFLHINDCCSVLKCDGFQQFTVFVEHFVERELFFHRINQERHYIKNLCIGKLCFESSEDFTDMRLHGAKKRRIIFGTVIFPCIVYTDKHNNNIGFKIDAVFCQTVIDVICTVACNTFYININLFTVFSEFLFQLCCINIFYSEFKSES